MRSDRRVFERIATPMPRILAVDDEPNIVRLIEVNLTRHGYTVDTANNGVQALEKIRTNRPDLVVSDVMMPEMDGFELLSSIRRDPALESLPVIMLTAKAGDKDVMSGYSRGADMYLTKPFNPAELLAFVKRILQSSEGGGADGRYTI
jgi:two-component system, OmpR family, alkaline phosphatase synthesis response regulator PhoP